MNILSFNRKILNIIAYFLLFYAELYYNLRVDKTLLTKSVGILFIVFFNFLNCLYE